jgi:hypothetical protein
MIQVIKKAKLMHYNKQILEADNKVKAIREIVKRKQVNTLPKMRPHQYK